MVIDNKLAWVHNKKAVLSNDRVRWLEIIEMFYTQFKLSDNPDTKRFLKDQMKFCGEQSQEIKKLINQIK